MKLIWHIIRKDVVRDRWALLLWALLFVAQVAVGSVMLHDSGADRDWIMGLQFASAGLVVAQFVMGYVLVARLVQDDLLLGTDMFWITRPISPGRLLAAKSLGALLLFGLLPVALLAPWWFWCGFEVRDLFWTAVETLGWQLLMIAPAFLTAALTNDLGRVLMWTILLFVATMMGIGLLASTFKDSSDGNGIVYTRAWLACVMIVFGSTGVATHQYLTRRLAWSIGLTTVLVGLVATVALFPNLNWARGLAGLTERGTSPETAAAMAGVKPEVGAIMPGEAQTKGKVDTTVITEIYFQGLPENLGIIAGENQQVWHWRDGLSIRRPSYIGTGPRRIESYLAQVYGTNAPVKDPETTAYIKAAHDKEDAGRVARGLAPLYSRRPGQTLVAPSRPGYRLMVYSSGPKAMLTRMSQDPAAYESKLAYAVTQPAIVAELPLREGAHGSGYSVGGRVLWANLNQTAGKSDGMAISMLVTAPVLRRNGLWLSSAMVSDARNFLINDIYAVNRTTGSIYRAGGYSARELRNVMVAGVVLNWNFPTVNVPRVIRNGVWVDQDPQWADHTVLVLASEQIVGRFTVDLKTDRLEFKPSRWQAEEEKSPAAKN